MQDKKGDFGILRAWPFCPPPKFAYDLATIHPLQTNRRKDERMDDGSTAVVG